MNGQAEFTFDLFVSYTEADHAWVEGYLLDALEAAQVRVHSEETFRLGAPRLTEFGDAIKNSQRTLLVLSPDYLANNFRRFFNLMAQAYDLEQETWRIIPLLLKPLDLPPELQPLAGLDATDEAAWPRVVERLCLELQKPVPGTEPPPPCPYPGMVPFREKHHRFFFGRSREIRDLRGKLQHQNLVLVIGPSGSGKSSLVFAGLVPELAEKQPDHWMVLGMRPGEEPLTALAETLGMETWPKAKGGEGLAELDAALARHSANGRLLLIVDQLEELFAQAPSQASPFIAALKALGQDGRCALLLTMRADFFGELINSDLWPLDAGQRLEVEPLRGEALREAIAGPAERVAVYLESALVDRLLADAAAEPGVLPLVQETMRLLWQEMKRRFIPLSAYEALGEAAPGSAQAARSGLAVAMQQVADGAYARLPGEGKTIARRIFLRLIQFGEGRPDTRRQQPATSLRSARDPVTTFNDTLRELTDSRLLTLSSDDREDEAQRRVDIAHEGLIDGWPRLGGWIAEHRAAEQARRRLETKAEEWKRLAGKGGLLDEFELLEAETWLASPDAAELGSSLTLAGLVAASRDGQEETARQRRRGRLIVAAAIGAVAALLILAIGIWLWSGTQVAREEAKRLAGEAMFSADQATLVAQRLESAEQAALRGTAEVKALATAEAAATELAGEVVVRTSAEADARQKAQIALARQLAAQAESVRAQEPRLLPQSVLLAAESLQRARTLEGDQALRRGLKLLPRPVASVSHSEAVYAVAFSPDGRWLASADGNWFAEHGELRVWNAASGKEVARMAHDSTVYAVAFSPDGQRLASGSEDGTVRVWDPASGDEVIHMEHDGPVHSLAYSPDGQRLASAANSWAALLGEVRVWDPGTGHELARMAFETQVRTLAFSPDGRWLASGSDDGTARVWDTSSGDELVRLGHSRPVVAVAFSPDGQRLASADGDWTGRRGQVRVWDVTSGNELVRVAHAGPARQVAFSSDGQRLASAADNWGTEGSGLVVERGEVVVWDAATGDELARVAHSGRVSALVFSPDGQRLASSSDDGTARVWDSATGEELARMAHNEHVVTVAFSPDGRWLASGSADGTARVWEPATADEAARMTLADQVNRVAFSPDGRYLATADGDWGVALQGQVRVWDPATGGEVSRMVHGGAVLTVAFAPDGRLLASGGCDRMVQVWEPATGQVRAQMAHDEDVWAVAFSPDEQLLASAESEFFSERGQVRLWDLTTGQELIRMVHHCAIWTMAFSPDGQRLASGCDDGKVRVWDTATGDELARMAHDGSVYALAFDPTGQRLASASDDGTARVWDPVTGDELARLGHDRPVRALGFSPDGQRLASAGDDGTVRVWDPVTGQELARLAHDDAVNAVAFSADGRRLASGSTDNTLRVWDPTTGEELARMAHDGHVLTVAFSPDGQRLVSGSTDGTARLWLWRPEDLAAEACRRLYGNLTQKEWDRYLGKDMPYACTCPELPPGEGTGLETCPERSEE